MTTRTLAIALAAALCGLMAAPAHAQNAAPAPAAKTDPKTPAGQATVVVTVTNSRKSDLVQLQAAESGSADWKKVLGGLQAGKKARGPNCRTRSTAASTCTGPFADGQSMDVSAVDVCAEKTLNLTD